MRIQTFGAILLTAAVLAGCGGGAAAPSSAAPSSAAAKPSAAASAPASAKPAASAAASAKPAASASAKPAASGAAGASAKPAASGAAKPAASGAAAAPSVPASVTLAINTNATLGKILTDDKNRTLYTRVNDTPTGSGCTGGCLTTWPPLYSNSVPTAPAGLTGTLALATRADNGAKQVMLGDKPLYYFAPDTNPGDAKGEGVGDPQTWHVIKIS